MKTDGVGDAKRKLGFSLVEMIVVIAVIGIIAAIAVPTIGNMTEKADDRKARRNAQNLAVVSAVAVSAGATVNFTNVDTAVQDISDGVFGANSFADTVFQVPGLSTGDLAEAKQHLEIDGGALEYVP